MYFKILTNKKRKFMGLEKCPKCSKESLIKTPHSNIMTEKLGCMLHTATEHSFDCLDKQCGYTSGIIRVNTEMGNKLSLPWYKRIF